MKPRGMTTYIGARILRSVPLLLGISVIVFALIHAAPGGPLTVYLSNPNVTPDDIARLEAKLGLDRPLPVQYASWLWAFARGDWGYSYVDGRPVTERILERAPATLELMVSATILALILSLLLGSAAALHPRHWASRFVSAGSVLGISVPTFWLGLVLQLIFAVELRLLPTAGRMSPGGGERLAYLVLPVSTLALFYASSWIRYVRASLIETLQQPFIRAGRGRGILESHILFVDALPNAIFPLITVWALDFAMLFSGAVVTETVFAWPGMGTLLLDSVYRRDYSVLMGILMAGSALIIGFNLAADVLYGWLDPRVRLVEESPS